jgi:hypothetical protein
MSDRRHAGEPLGCPNCDHDIEPGALIVPVTGGLPDERLGWAHANCPPDGA